MRNVVLCLMVSTWVAWVGGCAETGACPSDENLVDGVCAPEPRSCDTEATTRSIPVGCVSKPQIAGGLTILSWELTIEPVSIKAGKEFSPIVRGEVSFAESDLNTALRFLPEGFTRVEVLSAQGRITVRGAETVEGREVVLEADIPKSCTYDEGGQRGFGAGPFPPCVADEDCIASPEPPDPPDRCAAFKDFETSNDCTADGKCDELGETGDGSPCMRHGFCAVGGVDIAVGPDSSGIYRAEGPGSVFFGWADDVPLIKSGVDRGAYAMSNERRSFGEEIRRSGSDVRIVGVPLPITFECAMGVLSRGPDGPPTTAALLSPAPSSALISCPVQGP